MKDKVLDRVVCLRGAKVTLRPIYPKSDLPFCLRWINDSEVNRFLKMVGPVSESEEIKYLEGIHKNPNERVYAIETLEDGRFIGTMGLHRISWTDRTATTGSLIGEKDCWGKGYGTDAKMILLHHAFYRLNLRLINSSVIAFNKRSANCLTRCGYQVEHTQKDQFFRKGRYYDRILFRITRKNFDPLWKEYSKKLIKLS